MNNWYDTAQICLNGHVINSMAQSSPENNQKFCDQCGAETITNCKSCNAPIRGYYHVEGAIVLQDYTAPSFCYNCGKPYPWIEKKLMAAKELADEIDSLSEEEKEILKKSIDELVEGGPKIEVASVRFKKIVGRAGSQFAQAFKEILIDVLSEAAKKAIWPNP
ncbi:MAG: DUF2321 domain-containing protein [Thermanaeromonas sp.]|uniref:DUF2321 domain-containing protein n=1 Tax=Thermanaeromonas sp. TaxID=2003697 RepID=UPI002440142D|nr:DUF2321 domain-containing protein [Thermanaeromonas sp.]MCG0278217.1 DUF2321 domain-containing protein [Thermanaeromonas sp.]